MTFVWPLFFIALVVFWSIPVEGADTVAPFCLPNQIVATSYRFCIGVENDYPVCYGISTDCLWDGVYCTRDDQCFPSFVNGLKFVNSTTSCSQMVDTFPAHQTWQQLACFGNTARPSSQPSSQPSGNPTFSPTEHSKAPITDPTTAPTPQPTTASPSINPTPSPTFDPDLWQSLLSSPSYSVRNGYAFAVLVADGTVRTWGEGVHGGDFSAVPAELNSSITTLISTRFAFTAVRSSGTRLAAWGAPTSIRGAAAASVGPVLTHVVGNEAAFAGIDSVTGAIVALGSKYQGGDVTDDAHCNGYAQQLASGAFTSITASAAAFAALQSNGDVYAWGNRYTGGGTSTLTLPALSNVVQVVATREAFAARTTAGRIIPWGSAHAGGDASEVAAQLMAGIVHLVASKSAFVAVNGLLGLVVWGSAQYGGDASSVQADLASSVTFVAHTFCAFAAVQSSGSVVSWGRADCGGDSSTVQAQLASVVKIYGTGKAFAAVNATGGVVAWGKASQGGEIPADKVAALASGVVSIQHTNRAFAALKSDGSVVVWGQAGHGGDPGSVVEALLHSGVHTICANDVAFSAIKTDGSVVGWGHEVSIPTPGMQFTSTALTSGMQCA